MGEILPFKPEMPEEALEYPPRETIQNAAYDLVYKRYGSRSLTQENMPRTLAYHNLEHTLDVVQAAQHLSRIAGLTPEQHEVVILAASAHDIQHDEGEENELLSAGWLIDRMIDAGYNQRQMWMGALAILGTEPIMENGEMKGQLVDRYSEFSEELREVAQVLASADLAGLFSPRGPLQSHRLYQELQGVYLHEDPPLENLIAFQTQQIELATTYKYPHPQAQKLFAKNRINSIEYHQLVLGQLYNGSLASWQQLIDQDSTFMRQNEESDLLMD